MGDIVGACDPSRPVAVSEEVPAGRGLVLTRDTDAAALVLDLAPYLLINARTAQKWLHSDLVPTRDRPSHERHHSGERLGQSHAIQETPLLLPLTSYQLLAVLLAKWKTHPPKGDGQVAAFVDSLPKAFPTSPLVWSLSGTKTASLINLLPEPTAELCRQVRAKFDWDWAAVKAVQDRRPELLRFAPGESPIDLAAFAWAWCCVNSRCVYLPLGLTPHSDNFTLAPVLDMCNHTWLKADECKVSWTAAGGLQLRAPSVTARPAGLRRGDELFISYGAHSNGTLLSEYGFVLGRIGKAWDTGNPYVEVRLDKYIEALLDAWPEREREDTKQLLQENGYWRDYTIHPHPAPAHPSHRLVVALRLLALEQVPARRQEPVQQQRQLLRRESKRQRGKRASVSPPKETGEEDDSVQAWLEMTWGQRDLVSADNEARAHGILRGIVNEAHRAARARLDKVIDLVALAGEAEEKESLSLIQTILEEEVDTCHALLSLDPSSSAAW